jgi:hypothetical protein
VGPLLVGVWVVDPDWYFHTAAVLGQAASELAGAGGIVADHASFASLHMAGDDPIGAGWGGKYDAAATNTVQGVASLSRAWSALAGRVYQAGVNHAWAEFNAGRGRLPSPTNLPHRPAISLPNLSVQSSVGGNGAGLTEVLPGLTDAVGTETPNADTDKLGASASAWGRFGSTISQTVDKVIHQVKRPDPSLPDATAFYDTIVKVTAPGDALSADAQSLSSFASSFSTAASTMRQQISNEIYTTTLLLGGSAAVAILATRVTGTASIRAEVAVSQRMIRRAGQNIRGYINALQTAASVINTFTPVFQAAMKAVLDKNSLVPAEGFERNPDGTIKPTVRYFDRAKWEAWQRYLERGGDWDIDRWSKAYDQLKENSANGYWYDQHVAEVLGYTSDENWHKQYSDANIAPGRRWDWANVIDGRVVELVENKSGRLDFDQLALDEQALARNIDVTYNINANYNYSAAEIAALERLQKLYPDQFIVNRI